jgi:hypothetical protein
MKNSYPPYHQFDAEKFTFKLWRLNDSEYRQLRLRSFPIQINPFLLLDMSLEKRRRDQSDTLNLPKSLLVLEENFGPSSTSIDTWKQTFSFTFLMAIEKSIGIFHYLFKIEDYRGALEFKFCRIINDLKYTDKSVEVYHSPIDDELSSDEMAYIIRYLWGYLQGYSRYLSEITPFFRHIDSNHIIYGYWDGKFVERVIENSTKYEKIVRSLEERFKRPELSEIDNIAQIQNLIQAIENKT